MRLRVLAGLLAAAIAWLPGTMAQADEGIAWTVAVGDNGTERPNFVYEAQPGQVVEDTWVVANAGTENLSLNVYAADALTTASGQLDLQPAEQPAVGVGAWVKASATTLTLQPGESKDVSFSMSVPAGTAPGDYAGGIITSMLDETDATVQIERRLATRIHVRVPGALTTSVAVTQPTVTAPLALNPFAPVPVRIDHQVLNDGTARAFAHERITVAGPGGLGRTSVTRQAPEVLPKGNLEQTFDVAGVWALGPTTVSVEVTPEGIDGSVGAPVTAEATVWLIPWGWVAVAVVLVAVGVIVAVVRSRRGWEWVDASAAEATSE